MSKSLRDRLLRLSEYLRLVSDVECATEARKSVMNGWVKDVEDAAALADQAQAEPDRRLQIAMQNYERWKSHALELSARLQQYEPGAGMALNAAPQPAAPKVQP